MGMEIHAARALLRTLNTNFFYIDLNNHLISFLRFILSRATVYMLQISVLCQRSTKHSTKYLNLLELSPASFSAFIQSTVGSAGCLDPRKKLVEVVGSWREFF
jgi:hypothetical protein